MVITQEHYQFWCERKARVGWFQSKNPPTSIHRLIPRQKNPGDDNCTHNTLNLLKSVRRRKGTILNYLERLACDPGTVVNPKKRSALARKWAARIKQN